MEQTLFMHFTFQWPWICPNNLRSKSWPTIMWKVIFVLSKNYEHFSIKKNMDWTRIFQFFFSDLELSQMTFRQNYETYSDDKQSLCEVRVFNRQRDGRNDSSIPLNIVRWEYKYMKSHKIYILSSLWMWQYFTFCVKEMNKFSFAVE